jgi:hypothetical protein
VIKKKRKCTEAGGGWRLKVEEVKEVKEVKEVRR